jgi:LPXTG-motif cell wall-anchored protein
MKFLGMTLLPAGILILCGLGMALLPRPMTSDFFPNGFFLLFITIVAGGGFFLFVRRRKASVLARIKTRREQEAEIIRRSRKD